MRILTDCPDQLVPGFKLIHTPPPDAGWVECFREHTGLTDPVVSGEVTLEDLSPIQVLVAVASAQESQFDQLLRAGDALPNGVATVAVQGRKFHGQRGRPWSACPGNIHLSVLLHPQKAVDHYGAALTLVPALAACNTLKRIKPEGDVGIKWVNDVLISGRKVSGVIAATRLVSNRLQSVVFGVGINVESVPEIPSTPFVPKASSLKQEWDLPLRWNEVLPVLLQELSKVWRVLDDKGPAPLVDLYKQASLVIGRHVSIYDEEVDRVADVKPLAEGKVVDILPDLSLVLENQPDPVSRGRLAFIH